MWYEGQMNSVLCIYIIVRSNSRLLSKTSCPMNSIASSVYDKRVFTYSLFMFTGFPKSARDLVSVDLFLQNWDKIVYK